MKLNRFVHLNEHHTRIFWYLVRQFKAGRLKSDAQKVPSTPMLSTYSAMSEMSRNTIMHLGWDSIPKLKIYWILPSLLWNVSTVITLTDTQGMEQAVLVCLPARPLLFEYLGAWLQTPSLKLSDKVSKILLGCSLRCENILNFSRLTMKFLNWYYPNRHSGHGTSCFGLVARSSVVMVICGRAS